MRLSTDGQLAYSETLIALEQELARIVDGKEWLWLILDGYNAKAAAQALGHDEEWLLYAQDACAKVLVKGSFA
jgi:hypothetical protein